MTDSDRRLISVLGGSCEDHLRLANTAAQYGCFDDAAHYADIADDLSMLAFRVATGAAA